MYCSELTNIQTDQKEYFEGSGWSLAHFKSLFISLIWGVRLEFTPTESIGCRLQTRRICLNANIN